MDEVPKRVKRAIQELAGAAYEIELGRALAELRAEFTRWERGDMTSFDLVEAVHKFHQGPARDLYVRYTSGMLNMAVAHAIVTGVLIERRSILRCYISVVRSASTSRRSCQ
jgi:hypothetical protein